MANPRAGGRNVAVVGATGAVGEILLEVLAEREYPVRELRPLASARSVGTHVTFAGESIEVALACPETFEGCDLVFFAATGSLSRELAPEVVRRGGIAIDKSGSWRLHDEVPLVIPEINSDDLAKHSGIVACPNCTTIGFAMVLEPLRRAAGLRRVVVTTLQAVSGTGKPGLEELESQLEATRRGEDVEPEVYAAPIAHNVVPLCETFREDGYSTEEVKLLHETRKILGLPDLDVSVTCARVPVRVGHSASILVETEREITAEAAREVLAAFPGVEVVDEPAANRFPTALDAVGRDAVLVGRVRRDLGSSRLWMWQVCDNLRKGAATNAVQIAEELIRRGLV